VCASFSGAPGGPIIQAVNTAAVRPWPLQDERCRSLNRSAFHGLGWVTVLILASVAALTTVSVFLYRQQEPSLAFAEAVALALFSLVGLVASMTTRVVLYSDSLAITANLRRRTYSRTALDRVTWEGGVGVSLRLTSGEWIRLPDVGNSQSVSNSIRAWLKRTEGRN